MLRMFVIVSSVFQVFFANVLDEWSKCFIVFRRMLQLLYLDVSKLDRVLHLPPRLLLPRLSVKRGKQGQVKVVPLAWDGPHVHARARDSMRYVK
jgi:hypothetical protein